MKIATLLFFLIVSSTLAYSQESMIVFFTDKEQSSEIAFTDRAMQRRIKNNVQIDEQDYPVNKSYVLALAADGEILNTSRWLNAVSYSSKLSKETLLAKYDFIREIRMTGSSTAPSVDKKLDFEAKALNYGNAFEQIDQMNLNCMHDLGFTGTGIYIGIIDAGFQNMDSINYFDTVYLESRVIDTYDFVNSSSYVYDYSGHGTAVTSCIVAETGDTIYAGAAIDVDLALYVAEDVGSETEIEEFNVVAALERCDSVGVDVVNISLGYFGFDDTLTSHVYADLDGVTTLAAIGVNVAFTKGIIVSTSAGNSGPSNISTPCDADDCLCVGAVDEFDAYAFFSSVGPSADGQVKPDVATRGLDTWVVVASGNLTPGSGTSFSSPLLAGAIACLVEANPTKTAQEVIDAIRESAHLFAAPDTLMGYGIPNLCLANDILNSDAGVTEFNAENIRIYPVPSNDYFVIDHLITKNANVDLRLINNLGEKILVQNVAVQDGKLIVDITNLSPGVYTLELMDVYTTIFARKRVLIAE